MNKYFVIVAHVPTASITEGFLPELRRRNQPLLVVTDQPVLHQELIEQGLLYADEILAVDVFNPIAILNLLNQNFIEPVAIFTNSDHLQTSTAIVADYYGLPNKDWRACFQAKNKLAMRRVIQDAGLDTLWFKPVSMASDLADVEIPFPCIAKPIEGVASENVSLVKDEAELKSICQAFWLRNPGQALLLEEYIPGALHTLETLGDGHQLQVMGSFETYLSEPPYFIELGQTFNRQLDAEIIEPLLAQIKAVGVGFSSCHTEFVMTDKGPRLIEINYRNIGDQSDFLLAQALHFNLFGAVVDIYLGLAMPQVPDGSHYAQIHCQIADRSGVIDQVPGNCTLERDGCTVYYEPLCKSGEYHQQDNSNRDYLSILRGTGPTETQLSKVMTELVSELSISFSSDNNAAIGEA
ncbi:ATP-grasp domain-containing protein [Aliamphritea ceti]|uniref:ATP-grasp domain-containing protein n=1 Tax=Aliamphritea ceti TaxID=1524258 RepID=UPI0021C4BF6F|nr:ATP-grasp domain-containing protein [Aliamphritea ceti]